MVTHISQTVLILALIHKDNMAFGNISREYEAIGQNWFYGVAMTKMGIVSVSDFVHTQVKQL